MHNPFIYGREVGGAAFFNRTRELAALKRDVSQLVNLLIYSPRRYGKTSLVKRLLELVKQEGIVTCYCNLYPLVDEEDFISLFSASLAGAIREPLKKGMEMLRSLFTSISPAVTMGEDGKPIFTLQPIQSRGKDAVLGELLDALSRYAEKKKKQAVLVFDEFQQVGLLPTDRLEKTLRTHFESHTNVSYVFLGSRRHVLQQLFSHPKRAFYRSVKQFPLERMEADDYAEFIRNGFAASNLNSDEATIRYLIDRAERHPYYVQYLSHEVWDMAIADRRVVDSPLIDEALSNMISREAIAFQNIWDYLTLKQREALRAVSGMNEGELPFSQSFLSKHSLGSAASFRKSLTALVEKDLIEKDGATYRIQDFLFRRWIQLYMY